MRITSFAALTRTTVHALRHYEALGLLLPQRLPNNYRDYAPEQVREAVFITMSRQVGIGLPVIAEHLPRYRTGKLRPADMVDLLHARRDELDAQIQDLRAQRQTVVEHAAWIEAQARASGRHEARRKPWPSPTRRRRSTGTR